MGNGSQQAALSGKRNDLSDIGQDLLPTHHTRSGCSPVGGAVAQLGQGSTDEVRDDVDSDDIFLTTVLDMAKIIGQLRQETVHQFFVHTDGQAFQFLQAAALRAQPAFSNLKIQYYNYKSNT